MHEASAPRPGLISELRTQFADRRHVLIALVAIALLVYGFQLFNFNLSIDEEIHGNSFDPAQWVSQRRWGMYVVNRVLLPYTVVPVVPLAIGLVFHLAGVILLLKAWDVVDPTEQFLVGAVAVATPTMAYLYTFDTIGYGVGVGLFMTALSIALFAHHTGVRRYLAAIPAGFALAIYQTFALALVAVFVVWAVRVTDGKRGSTPTVLSIAGVGAAAAAIYAAGQVAFMALLEEEPSTYVDQFFDFDALRERTSQVVRSVTRMAMSVYRGDDAVFARVAWGLPILIAVLFAGFVWSVVRRPQHPLARIAVLAAFPVVMGLPFAGGLLSGGYIALRFLVALPFALAGLVALGLPPSDTARRVLAVIAGVVLLQFAVSSNSLFGSTHLALEQDRVLAARLIHEVETAMRQASTAPQYLEMVGMPQREDTPLVARGDTIGGSFFEWDGGNVHRVRLFLNTLGFGDLRGLPVERRGEFVAVSVAMPDFPAPGSVVVSGDVVVVRFGPYTSQQLASLCPHYPEVSVCSDGTP